MLPVLTNTSKYSSILSSFLRTS